MDDVAGTLAAARDAYRRRDWAAARERFRSARAAGELAAADLDALGDAAWWLTFTGYDLAPDAIARARSEAAGLANARFEVRDAARLQVEEPLDVVFSFDAIHDQADPAAVLERIHDALGLGAAWREQAARTMVAEAGFGGVTVHEAPGDPMNAVFATSRPA